jgi:hypothetical protein
MVSRHNFLIAISTFWMSSTRCYTYFANYLLPFGTHISLSVVYIELTRVFLKARIYETAVNRIYHSGVFKV